MPATQAIETSADGDAGVLGTRGAVILTRIAAQGGATRTQLVRDLAQLFAHKLSPAEWRRVANDDVDRLVEDGFAVEEKGRLSPSEAGVGLVEEFLGRKGAAGAAWADLRDGRLVAKGLGLGALGPKKHNALLTPDGLRAFILQVTYGLPTAGMQTVAKLRAQLAVVALERAFGNKIKTGLGAGSGFSAKAGRLLAGQLSTRPRDFGSDARLVAALAAEAVDARQNDADALRTAILRRLATSGEQTAPRTAATSVTSAPHLKPVAANDAGLPGSSVPPTRRPDPGVFAKAVQAAAIGCAEGWAGNRKALISRVFPRIVEAHPEWRLSEIEFKAMLAEAHRSGHLLLATADLKDKSLQGEIEASAITYKNTQWHLIRVVETG